MEQIDEFLSNELNFEVGRAAHASPVRVYALKCLERNEFYYTFLVPNMRLSEFEDELWIKISKGGHSQYGSIWFTEEGRPYLLRGEPVPLGDVQIVEARALYTLKPMNNMGLLERSCLNICEVVRTFSTYLVFME